MKEIEVENLIKYISFHSFVLTIQEKHEVKRVIQLNVTDKNFKAILENLQIT